MPVGVAENPALASMAAMVAPRQAAKAWPPLAVPVPVNLNYVLVA